LKAPESWSNPLDLTDYLSGEIKRAQPSILTRSDGHALLYPGRVNELHGEPEAGKGFIVGQAVGEVLSARERVVYLDFDVDPVGVIDRVLAYGLPPDRIEENLSLYAIDEPLMVDKSTGSRMWPVESGEALAGIIGDTFPSLVVIDGVNLVMGLFGLDPNVVQDVADLMRLLAFPFRKAGACVLLVDHVTKDRMLRGRFQYGSIQKMASLDGASYEIQVQQWPAPGKIGKLRMAVSKDRHGAVREFAERIGQNDIAAEVTIDSTGEGIRVSIDPITPASAWRPTWYMQKVSEYLEACLKPMTGRQVRANVSGHTDRKSAALEMLVSDGYVRKGQGERGPVYTSIKPFRDSGNGSQPDPEEDPRWS
jgi:hypothetical protein